MLPDNIPSGHTCKCRHRWGVKGVLKNCFLFGDGGWPNGVSTHVHWYFSTFPLFKTCVAKIYNFFIHCAIYKFLFYTEWFICLQVCYPSSQPWVLVPRKCTTGYSSGGCICKKAGLRCSAICHCVNTTCENTSMLMMRTQMMSATIWKTTWKMTPCQYNKKRAKWTSNWIILNM